MQMLIFSMRDRSRYMIMICVVVGLATMEGREQRLQVIQSDHGLDQQKLKDRC
jgi:hypothetical protein